MRVCTNNAEMEEVPEVAPRTAEILHGHHIHLRRRIEFWVVTPMVLSLTTVMPCKLHLSIKFKRLCTPSSLYSARSNKIETHYNFIGEFRPCKNLRVRVCSNNAKVEKVPEVDPYTAEILHGHQIHPRQHIKFWAVTPMVLPLCRLYWMLRLWHSSTWGTPSSCLKISTM